VDDGLLAFFMIPAGSEPMGLPNFLAAAIVSVYLALTPSRPRRRQLCAAIVGGDCWAGGNQGDVRAPESR
jgi:hypothetical protein